MPLYLVSATDCNGENKDLFVKASRPSEAQAHMLAYYETELEDHIALRMIEVPAEPHHHGPIDWDKINQTIVLK